MGWHGRDMTWHGRGMVWRERRAWDMVCYCMVGV